MKNKFSDCQICFESTSDKVLYKNSLTHSAWGMEPASYKFDLAGHFVGEVGIQGILFQPINPKYVEFEIESSVKDDSISNGS